LALFFLSCKDKKTKEVTPQPEPVPASMVVFSFNAVVDKAVLTPTTGYYFNESGDQYSITKFNYYISNISLSGDGTTFTEPESYHLIKHCDGLTAFTLAAVNPGTYTKIRFLIGVDSLRNVTGAQTGALDPVNQMFWEWSSGYIFYKLEGTFVSKNNPIEDVYNIHVGGFKGADNCLRWVEITLPAPLLVDGTTRTIKFNTNVAEIFRSPQIIGFDNYYPIVNSIFPKLASNYSDMFSVKGIE
jgi:hypothetical protein